MIIMTQKYLISKMKERMREMVKMRKKKEKKMITIQKSWSNKI